MKRNDTKSPSQLKKPTSIGWQKEIHMRPHKIDDLEEAANINDEWQKHEKKELERLKKMVFNDGSVFDNITKNQVKIQEHKVSMTLQEYRNYKLKQKKQKEDEKKQYYKDNPMNKKVVDKILDFFKKPDYIFKKMNLCPCTTCFAIAFDPINRFGIKEDDWFMGLYKDLVDGQLNEIYKHNKEYQKKIARTPEELEEEKEIERKDNLKHPPKPWDDDELIQNKVIII
jgi:membrane-bound lytic murein transglycosylase